MNNEVEKLKSTVVMDLATKEFTRCHSMLDLADIPTHVNDNKLSLSQRVAICVAKLELRRIDDVEKNSVN